MRIILQRVTEASVAVEGKTTGSIERGYLILVGFEPEDNMEDMEWSIKKLQTMRLFEDNDGKMNHNIKEVNGGLLVVSQFTLHAKIKKGTRPSFARAAPPDIAEDLYEKYLAKLKSAFPKVANGIFGADMKVSLVNDGPVTLFIDTKNRE